MTLEKLDELEKLLSKCMKAPIVIQGSDLGDYYVSDADRNFIEEFDHEAHAELFKAAIELMPELISLARDSLLWDAEMKKIRDYVEKHKGKK